VNCHLAVQLSCTLTRYKIRPSITGLRKQWCPDIIDLLERMWAHDPNDRPTMSEVVKELERIATWRSQADSNLYSIIVGLEPDVVANGNSSVCIGDDCLFCVIGSYTLSSSSLSFALNLYPALYPTVAIQIRAWYVTGGEAFTLKLNHWCIHVQYCQCLTYAEKTRRKTDCMSLRLARLLSQLWSQMTRDIYIACTMNNFDYVYGM
jgi:hypothetical protein